MTTTHHLPTTVGTVPRWTLEDRLRKSREVAGLSQTELAAEIGISRRSVSNYEAGITSPNRPALLTWALRCGVPYDWLAHGIEPDAGGDAPGNGKTRPLSTGESRALGIAEVIRLPRRSTAPSWAVAA